MAAIRSQGPLPFDDRPAASRQAERLLSAQELADYLEVPVNTIYSWRHRDTGPPGFRIGKHLRYRWLDVQAWLDDCIAESG